MSMNSAHAFSHAISGSFTDSQMQANAAYVNQNIAVAQQMGGWLAQQATTLLDGFNRFMDSKAWEFSRRLDGQEGDRFLGQFEIGYQGSPESILESKGLMANYIMANPKHMQAMLDGKIANYEGLSHLCKGIGVENYFYRNAMHGVTNIREEDEKLVGSHAHFTEMSGGRISFTHRVNINNTWTAADHHRAKGLFDIKSDKVKEGSIEA